LKLWEYNEKNVRITLVNGHVYEGKAYDYTSALDNEPEIESICIGHTELYENEIANIEMI
jgi:predicted phosphodiesterase